MLTKLPSCRSKFVSEKNMKKAGQICVNIYIGMCRTSPEEFVARVEAQAEAKKPKPVRSKDFSLPSEPKAMKAMGASSEKTLEKVMKVELLEDKTAEEVAAIWTEFWCHKDAVSAAIPAAVYKEMKERFDKFNTFLFPLPRDKVKEFDIKSSSLSPPQGYEFVMVQLQGNQAHFSTLINFQVGLLMKASVFQQPN